MNPSSTRKSEVFKRWWKFHATLEKQALENIISVFIPRETKAWSNTELFWGWCIYACLKTVKSAQLDGSPNGTIALMLFFKHYKNLGLEYGIEKVGCLSVTCSKQHLLLMSSDSNSLYQLVTWAHNSIYTYMNVISMCLKRDQEKANTDCITCRVPLLE